MTQSDQVRAVIELNKMYWSVSQDQWVTPIEKLDGDSYICTYTTVSDGIMSTINVMKTRVTLPVYDLFQTRQQTAEERRREYELSLKPSDFNNPKPKFQIGDHVKFLVGFSAGGFNVNFFGENIITGFNKGKYFVDAQHPYGGVKQVEVNENQIELQVGKPLF